MHSPIIVSLSGEGVPCLKNYWSYIQSKSKAPEKTSGRCNTQLVKMSTAPKFVELTAEVFTIVL